jgi:hypothetical protein
LEPNIYWSQTLYKYRKYFLICQTIYEKKPPRNGAFRTVPVMGQFKRTIRYRSLFLLPKNNIFIIKKKYGKRCKRGFISIS